VLQLAEMPGELVARGRMILETAIPIPASGQAWLVHTALVDRWSQIHPPASEASSPLQAKEFSTMRYGLAAKTGGQALQLAGGEGQIILGVMHRAEGIVAAKPANFIIAGHLARVSPGRHTRS